MTVDFSQFSGESDATYGSNDWSIQANTNTFTGSNSQTDWVQAIEFNYPTYLGGLWPIYETCLQQWDLTTQSLGSDPCTSTSKQSLSSSFDNYEVLYSYSSGGTNYLESEYCQVNVQCWSSSAADLYGLAGHWSQVIGTILGLQRGSNADFTHPTSLTADAYLIAGSSNSASGNVQYITDEGNNLNPGTPSASCSLDTCEVSTPSSY